MNIYEKAGYLNTDFKIFHIKDQKQREFSFHYHDFHKVILFLKGDVSYVIEGCSYRLLPYDIVFVKAGAVHRPIIHSTEIYERIIIYISPDFLSEYASDSDDLTACFAKAQKNHSHVLRMRTFQQSHLYDAIKTLEQTLLDHEYASFLYLKLRFLAFMIELNRAFLHNDVHFVGNQTNNPKIRSILEYINEHLMEDIDIKILADTFFISRYYLMHVFKEETGYTIGNYINTKRLLQARELIAQKVPITEACFLCGFKNYSTFSRAYKKLFSHSARHLEQKSKTTWDPPIE